MNKQLLFTIAAASLVLTAVTPAIAKSCKPKHLQGEWAFFDFGNNSFGDLPFINGCVVILDRRGNLRRGSECPGATLDGQIEIERNCAAAGVAENSSGVECALVGVMTQGLDLISGVGACDNDDIFMFNLVKRP